MDNIEKQIMDFNVLIEQDEDGIYVARVQEIEGCYTQGLREKHYKKFWKELKKQ